MFRKKPKINPREEQLTKLQELGSKLQYIRTEKDIPLETVAKETRIPVRLLQAIETGDLDALPEPVYIRGLIKQFADFLELDGTELASEFPAYLEVKSSRSYFSLRLPSLHLRPIHLYFLYILLIMVSVRGISHSLRQSALESNSSSESIVQSSPTQKHSPKPTQPPAMAEKVPNTNKPVVVNIQLKDKCWLKVVVDGKTQFEGILPQGSHRTWVANKQLTVRAGNAGGVLITFNDQQPQPLGEPGQTQEITFQAKSGLH